MYVPTISTTRSRASRVAPTEVRTVRSAPSPTRGIVLSASRRTSAASRAAAVCVRAVARLAVRCAERVLALAAFCLREAALRVPCVFFWAAVRLGVRGVVVREALVVREAERVVDALRVAGLRVAGLRVVLLLRVVVLLVSARVS